MLRMLRTTFHRTLGNRAARAVLAMAGCAALLSGCNNYYDERFAFEPRPAQIESVDSYNAAGARTMVSVIGIHRGDDDYGTPAAVDLRIRVDNTGQHEVGFDPRDMRLLSGDLQEFGAPAVNPSGTQWLAPRQSTVIDASFPFPGTGAIDLARLQLDWTLDIGGRLASENVELRRRVPRHYAGYGPGYWASDYWELGYYDDYAYYPRHHYWGGHGYGHRRHYRSGFGIGFHGSYSH